MQKIWYLRQNYHKLTKYLNMKTTFSTIFLFLFAGFFAQGQIMIKGAQDVNQLSLNGPIEFVKKPLTFTRTAIENPDGTISQTSYESGKAKIEITKDGVFVTEGSDTRKYGEKSGPIVIDLAEAKQKQTMLFANNELDEEKMVFVAEPVGSDKLKYFKVNQKKAKKYSKNPDAVDMAGDYVQMDLDSLKLTNEDILGFVYFDEGSTVIKEKYYAELYKLKYLFEDNPNATVMLIGHVDVDGSESSNPELAKSRSESLYHFLTKVLNMSPNRFQLFVKADNTYDTAGYNSAAAITSQSQKNRSVTLAVK